LKSVSANFHQLTSIERRATFSLAAIIALRMLGLFMIFPVLILYQGQLEGATEFTIGVAIAIYGLTQAVLQIPFGMLSDRYGRKPVIVGGLSLFVLGSVVAACSSSIWGIIAGRVLQGGGAIAAAVLALTADLTREEVRTKSLAIIGMSIGLAVTLAFILGPVLNRLIGLSGIFWVTAALALSGILIVLYFVPTPESSHFHRDTEPVPEQFVKVIKDAQLMRLNLGILLLHAIFAACVPLAFPLILQQVFKLHSHHHWWVYIPVLSLSVLIMVPMIIIGEKFRRMKQVFIAAVLLVMAVELGFYMSYTHQVLVFLLMVLFFSAFNFLEAALPSLVSKTAPPESKGTAMGVYSTTQYFGTFVGGSLGGWVLSVYRIPGIFVFCMLLSGVWLLAALTMKNPRYLTTQLLNVGVVSESEARQLVMQLTAVQGVAEAVVMADEGVAYLKVDAKALDEQALFAYSKSG